MACSIFTTLAVTATLLGAQGLKLESQQESGDAGLCREDEVVSRDASVPNAVVVLKDAEGNEVYSSRIRVATTLFYDYGHTANDGHNHSRGGGVPEKAATFLFKFPRTAGTLGAKTIELKTFDGTFAQSTNLQASRLKTKSEAISKISLD